MRLGALDVVLHGSTHSQHTVPIMRIMVNKNELIAGDAFSASLGNTTLRFIGT